ncbi:SIS domain-containing protein [Thermatribacter velox]|uniref:Glutamine--fructose-6-phosphate aminotransferase [isomerizing] n=1 Tax=Thermatribacter velox TaxID=3039681 RepID=A0ABZ2YE43_9BACT
MNQLFKEIAEQPEVFRKIAETYAQEEWFSRFGEGANKKRKVCITGMGSSLFAAYPAYLHLLNKGFQVNWIDASELLHYGLEGLDKNDLLVLISQSGESYEVLRILDSLSTRPLVVSFTANLESTLAKKSDVVIDILSGPERAVTSTKTHTATLLVFNLWALAQAGERERFLHASMDIELMAEEAERVIATSSEWSRRILRNLEFARSAENRFIIARGPALSSAWHGCLCFYECAKESFFAFSGGQFRHGPLELITRPSLAIVLALPGKTQSLMIALAEELVNYKAGVLLIGQEGIESRFNLEVLPMHFADELFSPALSIIPLELLAYYLAEDKGLEPGTAYLISKTTTRE